MVKSADAFKTISEVANELDMPQHVLRFWESRFKQIKPLKRGGSRRYYRPDDVKLLSGIRHLLYNEGYTIKGVQRILKEKGVRYVSSSPKSPSILPEEQVESTTAIDVSDFVATPTVAPTAPSSSAHSPILGTPTAVSSVAIKDVLAELLECKRLLDQTR